jgi:hypothetical protein
VPIPARGLIEKRRADQGQHRRVRRAQRSGLDLASSNDT